MSTRKLIKLAKKFENKLAIASNKRYDFSMLRFIDWETNTSEDLKEYYTEQEWKNLQPTKRAKYYFPNGYGVSVIRGPSTYGGDKGLYELAVICKDGELTNKTPITNDVIGYLSEDEVSDLMNKVSELPPK
jgi:hypothetical protein